MVDENMVGEIEAMLNPTSELEGNEEVVDEVINDVAGEEAVADALETEEEAVSTEELSATEEAEAGGEPAAGEGEEEEDEEGGELVEGIEELRARIAEMSTPAQPAIPEEDGAVTDPLDLFKDDIPYITEENLAEIADNPLLLNAAMNNVRRQTAENLLNIVPQLIQNAIVQNTKVQEIHNTFYGKHKELAPYKQYVSSVAKDIQAKNPKKTQEEILDLVATSVKASLKLAPQKAAAKNKKPGGKPALRKPAGSGRANKPAAPASDMAAQIVELL